MCYCDMLLLSCLHRRILICSSASPLDELQTLEVLQACEDLQLIHTPTRWGNLDRIRPPELIHSLLLTEILVAQIAVKAIQGAITLDDDSNASDIKNHQPAAASVILFNGRIDLGSLQGLLFSLSWMLHCVNEWLLLNPQTPSFTSLGRILIGCL